ASPHRDGSGLLPLEFFVSLYNIALVVIIEQGPAVPFGLRDGAPRVRDGHTSDYGLTRLVAENAEIARQVGEGGREIHDRRPVARHSAGNTQPFKFFNFVQPATQTTIERRNPTHE